MNKINILENKEAAKSYRRVAVAACFGTFLEWYDFLTFATLAIIFAPLFFPSSDPSAGLLASLATFGAGMVVRPIGAAVFGSMGDRIGRKPVFMITIALMGLATFCVGFLPTYAQIGIWAPILLVSLRLLQGLSAGGEIGGSAVYLTEHAGEKHRGFKTSFLQLMGPLGILVSTMQVTFLQSWLTADEFMSWGWRVPFWVSLILLLVAVKARIALKETPIFLDLDKRSARSKSPLRDNFKDRQTRKHMFLLFFCISAGGAVLFFCIQVYTSIFLKTSVKLPPQLVDQLTIYATLALLPLTVFAGWLSDKVGRKPVIVCGLALGAVLILPSFHLLEYLGKEISQSNQNGNQIIMIASILIGLSTILALVVGPQTALLAELFSARNRNSAATLPHNLAAGWIGGMLPFIITWLNKKWASDIAGLWYPTIFLACAFILALLYLPETRKTQLSD
ncbi:MFS transporter [Polynucleobacter alcilacus]|uniref:MFS transporter n=1 Tax=Polynucleobacter alcilacus TaxID=1819739 RepID=UPI001C0BD713|nr:MFS transporter [Polynucleobacter alcilacus]MBU3567983.1 MHS family MFS transporter [Polynucleobacter alcilacus]